MQGDGTTRREAEQIRKGRRAMCSFSFFLVLFRALSCSKSRLAVAFVGDSFKTLLLKHVETWSILAQNSSKDQYLPQS